MKTKIIGLTGGIGSGKSTIAQYIAQKGIPVYIADDEAKKILYLPHVKQQLLETFGEVVFTDGVPDRKKIAALVFADADKLSQLNAIIHPEVAKHFSDWVLAHNSEKFVIKEAAILFESGSYKNCDAVILVTAPVETRIKRVMERDNASRQSVLDRMANQWADDKKKDLSDYIVNNEILQDAYRQTDSILAEINYVKTL